MIVERRTFYAKYGKGDALVNLFKRLPTIMPKADLGIDGQRIYTDVTGAMFRVITERTWADVGASQAAMGRAFANPAFPAWFAEMEPLIERGETEFLNVVQ